VEYSSNFLYIWGILGKDLLYLRKDGYKMSIFDTVNIKCPKCDYLDEVQTKAGFPNQREFLYEDAPCEVRNEAYELLQLCPAECPEHGIYYPPIAELHCPHCTYYFDENKGTPYHVGLTTKGSIPHVECPNCHRCIGCK